MDIKKIPYTKIDPKLDKRRKLTMDQRKEILIRFNNDETLSQLSNFYGVSDCCVRCICVPSYKAMIREKSLIAQKRRLENPEYKKKFNDMVYRAQKERLKKGTDQYEENRKYRAFKDKKYRNKNK